MRWIWLTTSFTGRPKFSSGEDDGDDDDYDGDDDNGDDGFRDFNEVTTGLCR